MKKSEESLYKEHLNSVNYILGGAKNLDSVTLEGVKCRRLHIGLYNFYFFSCGKKQ